MNPPLLPTKPCPVCGKEPSEKYTPFCGKPCEKRDLARWFSGAYSVPTQELPANDSEPGEE